jgi:RNase adaptor protein for sRNA GlmZ degradation
VDQIRLERQVVFALPDRADLVIDPSKLSAPDLKRLLTAIQCAFLPCPLPIAGAARATPS